ncbi:hypothetical protein Ccrd_018813 [Cynara cardunculus var. scolymus]|uniref:Peptidase C48, SUMO/Sentrin/Ubl1 n=1 Tax=Cynara cardunculus var. scolymus TaxID=59895 RepID=A0A118K1H4_CYNCS|nr:hypothetical protein Ccrd_018813 [Cynara cardunculus var. scolymus]
MRPKDVMNVVQKSDDAGVMFRMSFLVIVVNTLAKCSIVGVCNLGFLSRECIIMMGERIADLCSTRRETDMMLQAYVERFPGDRCFDQFKQELASMFKGSIWESRKDEGQPSDKELSLVHVTPPKMTTTYDPVILPPLSQFWTSPTVIAEVDRASNERAAITAKGVGCNTDPKLLEKVKMTSLEALLKSVGRVRSRSIDECEPRTSKLRRRAQTDIEAPAFDLGISPSKEEVIACIDSSKAIGGQENVRSAMPKRDPKLSFKLRSPYVTRAVTFEVSSDERKLQDWILRGIGGIFMDAIIRDEDLNANKRYDRFRKNIMSCMNNDKELISMRNVDLVFFPVLEPSFYYIVVFDLKRPSIAIIDSQTRDGKVDDIYGSSIVGLQDMMIMHLLKEGHGAWKVYAEMDQDHIKTRWQFHEIQLTLVLC